MRPRNERADASRHPDLETLQATIGGLRHLPTLPEAARRAMAVARDPASSPADLAAVIERDPALAAGVLRLANSPLYRTTWPSDTLTHAIVRVGMRECQSLILAVGLRSLYRKVPGPLKRRFDDLWQHSFLTACVCRHLGRALALGYEGEEFAAGLAHDLGRLLLGLAAPDHFSAADPVDFIEGPVVLLRERAMLGTDHCAFGAWFAAQNDLPPSLVNAVRYHHTPERAEGDTALVALVAAADHMANYLQREGNFEGYDAAANPAWPLLAPHAAGHQPFTEVAAAIAEAAKEAADASGATG